MSVAHTKPIIIGRSSSHHTRVVRIFAEELELDYELRVIRDLTSMDAAAYGGNPALKLPSLQTDDGVWFGALNACRELARQATPSRRVVWPEDLKRALAANTLELTVQAMATEVSLIMAKVASAEGGAQYDKMRESLRNSLIWLERNVDAALALLPIDRDLSYLEVALFCLVTHLEFRQVVSVADYQQLNAFCDRFGGRTSAKSTSYRFDAQ